MKAMKGNLALPLILLIGLAGLSIQCSNKKVNPIAPAQLEKTLRSFDTNGMKKTVTGLICDLKTGLGIFGVKVTVVDSTGGLNSIIGSGTSDGSGKFEIPGIPVDTFLVYMSKSGYVDAMVTAYVREYYWSVHLKTTYLIAAAKGVVIGASGGFIEDQDDEGDVIRLDIPSGALTADVGISLTHLQGMEIPSYPPKGHLSFATAQIGPDGMVFKNAAILTVPLPRTMPAGTQMPLYALNITDPINWQDTGIKAVVDAGGLTASAPITRATLYSVMPAIGVLDAKIDTLFEQIKVLPSANGFFTVTYKNQYENTAPEYILFPDGAPGINHATLRYMFEQFYGVPFTRPETETVFYESPSGFYPYQLIRILSIQGSMILQDPAAGLGFKVYIKRPAVKFVPHDQGCGY